MQIFSSEWITAFGKALNNSQSYKQSALTWEYTLLLVLQESHTNPERAIWLDIWHGECRMVREAVAADFEYADYILSANVNNWKQLLNKELAPLMAIMRGKLKLQKGSLAILAQYTQSAKELVYVAADIPATWDM